MSALCVHVLFLPCHHSTDGSKGNYRNQSQELSLLQEWRAGSHCERLATVHFHSTLTDQNKECSGGRVIAGLITPDCAAPKTNSTWYYWVASAGKMSCLYSWQRPRIRFSECLVVSCVRYMYKPQTLDVQPFWGLLYLPFKCVTYPDCICAFNQSAFTPGINMCPQCAHWDLIAVSWY